MSNPQTRGRDNKGKTQGLPEENSQGTSRSHGAREVRQESLSTPASTPEDHAQKALNDAQQGLHSLLNPPIEEDQPHIISLSGAARNQRRGRVAGPAVGPTDDGRWTIGPELAKDGRRLASNNKNRPQTTDSQLSIVHRPSSIPNRHSPARRPLRGGVMS